MNRKKLIAGAVGAVVLLGVGVALASPKKRKEIPPPPPDGEGEDDGVIMVPDHDLDGSQAGQGEVMIGDVTVHTPRGEVSVPAGELPVTPSAEPDDGAPEYEPPAQLPAATIPAMPPSPGPASQEPPPNVEDVEQPDTIDNDTLLAAAKLLENEAKTGWKKVEPILPAWQKSRGLKPDGKFGPQSALTMAREIGTVPIVRYWPSGAQKAQAVTNYRSALYAIASQSHEPRASQLRASAEREAGQSFGTSNPKPVTPLFVLEVDHGN